MSKDILVSGEDIDEYEYDDEGVPDWEMILPAFEGVEYVITMRNNHHNVYLRECDADTKLPFVQVHPDFRVNEEWPDPPEGYEVKRDKNIVKSSTDTNVFNNGVSDSVLGAQHTSKGNRREY